MSRQKAAFENLLKLYNETWSDEDHDPISTEEFARRIELDGISFSEGQDTVTIYDNDADLFAGHQIKIVAPYNGAVKSAGLP